LFESGNVFNLHTLVIIVLLYSDINLLTVFRIAYRLDMIGTLALVILS